MADIQRYWMWEEQLERQTEQRLASDVADYMIPVVTYADHVAAVAAIADEQQDAFAAISISRYRAGENAERYRIRQAVKALATERELRSPSFIGVDLWDILSIIDGGEA